MLFDYDLVVPAHTLETAKVRKVCPLTSGVLQEIRVKFPPGPATLVHVAIFDSLHQIMPANPDGTINLDDQIITSSNLNYTLTAPFELFVDGWSPEAVYEHRITAQFEVYPDKKGDFDTFQKLLSFGSTKKR